MKKLLTVGLSALAGAGAALAYEKMKEKQFKAKTYELADTFYGIVEGSRITKEIDKVIENGSWYAFKDQPTEFVRQIAIELNIHADETTTPGNEF